MNAHDTSLCAMQLLISLAGSSIGFFIVGAACFMHSYAFIVFGRVFSGLSGFSMGIAKAYIADVTSAADRATYIGRLGMFYGIAFITGPVIAIGIMFAARRAGASKETEWASVFFVAAALGVGAFVFAAFTLRESKPNMRGGTQSNSANTSLNEECTDNNTDAATHARTVDEDKGEQNDTHSEPVRPRLVKRSISAPAMSGSAGILTDFSKTQKIRKFASTGSPRTQGAPPTRSFLHRMRVFRHTGSTYDVPNLSTRVPCAFQAFTLSS